MSDEVLRGPLGVHKKKGVEERFFVLHRERLDYYGSEADLEAGAAPRGHIDLAEVASLAATQEDLVIHLQNGSQLCVRPPGEAALHSWSEALHDLVGTPRAASDVGGPGGAPPEPAGAPGTAPQGREEAPGAEEGSGATAAAGHEAPDEASGGPVEQKSGGSASQEVLCHGSLTVQRKGGFVLKYFVLRETSLTYFQQREDWEAGMDPRGVCALSDVVALEDCDGGGFLLRLAKPLSPLTLHTPTQQDLKMWVRELSTLLAPQIGLGAIKHRELQEGARHGSGSGQDPQAPFFEGELLHVKNKKTELKYFVLLRNCLEYFNSQDEFAKGAMPRGQVALSDVRLVTVGDQGLCVDLGERQFVLEVVGVHPGATLEGWGEAWEQVLVAAPRRGTCSGVHVRWERPRPSGARAPVAQQAGGAAQGAPPGTPPQEAAATGATAASSPGAAAPPPAPRASAAAPPPAPPSEPRATEPEPGRGPDPAADPVGAIQALLQRKNLRVADLFQASHCRLSSSENSQRLVLDEHGLREVCRGAGLELTAEESLKIFQAFDTAGKGRVDFGDMEAALRKHHRGRAHSVHGARPSIASNRARLQLAEKAKARLRSAGYGCGGVCWSRVFEHHARKDGRGICLPGFISMVRRDVKISYREMPDALLEQVFATVNASGTGGISFPEFLEWLGVQQDADREKREEQAAIKIQALMRGRMARMSVNTLKAQGPQVLRRGTFAVELRDGTTEKWMVIVYENRMECFGTRHGHRIMAGDIEDIEISDRCFLMEVRGGVKLSLRCPEGACMEEWMDAFSRLGAQPPAPAPANADSEEEVPWSSEDDEPSASMASMVSTAASAACTPQAGGSPLSPAGRGWRPSGPGACPKPSPLAEARAAPARAGRDELVELLRRSPGMAGFLGLPPSTPEQMEAALGRLAADGRQELSLAEVAALFGGADPSTPSRAASSPRPDRSPKGPGRTRGAAPAGSPRLAAAPKAKAPDRPWTVSPELLANVPEPLLQDWLSSLSDAPVHAGLLGFHEHGQVATRCAVLFHDRLDSWDTAADAVGGHLPRSRLALRDVRCVEMRGGGFVLKCAARRVALSLPAGGDVRAWLGPLHGLLPGPSRLPAARAACVAAQRRSRSASVKCFVPRCASLVPTPRPRSRESNSQVTLAASGCHSAQRDGIRINTHGGGLQAGLLLHGAEALVRPAPQGGAVSGKVNERAGALSARTEVCGKITGERQRSPGRAGAWTPSAKITGERQRSVTPRRAAAEVSGKITGEGRAATPERAAGCRLTAKVTDRGRDSSPLRARSASPVAAKITDAGRSSVGWARQPGAPLLDRMRPLGAPLSGAQGGALMTARLLF